MWSPRPTVFSLLTNQIRSLSTALASEYPAIHYALLYALLQDCRRYVSVRVQMNVLCITRLLVTTITTFFDLMTFIYPILWSFSSNRYYLPASTSVSLGGTSISPAYSSTPSATITDVLSLLAKQMQTHMLPFDIWYACMRVHMCMYMCNTSSLYRVVTV